MRKLDEFHEIEAIINLLEENILLEKFTLSFIEEIKSYLNQLKSYPITSIEFKWIQNEILTKLGSLRILAESFLPEIEELNYINRENKGKNVYELIDFLLEMLNEAEKLVRDENDLINALAIVFISDKIFNENFGIDHLSDAE